MGRGLRVLLIKSMPVKLEHVILSQLIWILSLSHTHIHIVGFYNVYIDIDR